MGANGGVLKEGAKKKKRSNFIHVKKPRKIKTLWKRYRKHNSNAAFKRERAHPSHNYYSP